MKAEFLTKGYVLKDKLREIVEKKLARLDKFFDADTKIKVKLKKSGNIETTELTIILDKLVLRSEVSSTNMYENIDEALPKLEKQIIKHRGKLSQSKKVSIKNIEKSVVPEIHDADKHKIVRKKKFELAPMTTEDAIEEMELIGHKFFVYLCKETKSVNVLYERTDGEYGVIETMV